MEKATNVIGRAPCLLKPGHDVPVKLSPASNLAYLHCNSCGYQLFARKGEADQLIRERIQGAAPAGDPPAKEKTEPVTEPKPSAKPAARDSWDLY